MAFRKIAKLILTWVAITHLFCSCVKNILGCHQSFSFTVNAKVYPDKDTVNIGDTIFVEVNFPTMLSDSSSNAITDLSGASGVSTDMGFVKLASDSPIVLDDAVPDFDFELIYGKEIPPRPQDKELIKLFSFDETAGRFLFKLAIIPKDTGTFRFGLASAPDVEQKNSTCPTFTLNYLLKNTTNQHYYLYPGGTGVSPGGADYYFYVK